VLFLNFIEKFHRGNMANKKLTDLDEVDEEFLTIDDELDEDFDDEDFDDDDFDDEDFEDDEFNDEDFEDEF
jgi:hypothetical protein